MTTDPDSSGVSASMSTAASSPAPPAPAPRRKLSAQQFTAVKMAERGDLQALRIQARAGTGKTTTMRTIAHRQTGRRVLYLVFNKANQLEAQANFPGHVKCVTTHALAYGQIAKRYKGIKEIGTIRLGAVADLLGMPGRQGMKNSWIVRQTMSNFCNSADTEFKGVHVPEMTRQFVALKASRDYPNNPAAAANSVRQQLQVWVNGAAQLWRASISTEQTQIALSHDAYLKLWSLEEPQINFDLIALDEAQDTNPCVLKVLMNQQAPLIAVGDRWQSIYGFRGAVNAMASIPGEETHLTETYRFGTNLERPANAILRLLGEKHLITGVSPIHGALDAVNTDKPYALIARTNARLCVEAVEQCGKVPTAIVGGADALIELLESGFALYKGRIDEVRDHTLRIFETWQNFSEYVASTSDGEMSMLYKLIQNEGDKIPGVIIALKTKLVPESQAHVVLSTAHKSKGREFNQVILADDYPGLYDNRGVLDIVGDELNLLYVAATRAKIAMNINSAVREAMNGPRLASPGRLVR